MKIKYIFMFLLVIFTTLWLSTREKSINQTDPSSMIQNADGSVSINYKLYGESKNIIGLPINPGDINTPAKLLSKTNGICNSIMTFDAGSKSRKEFFLNNSVGVRTLDKLEGGKSYLIDCPKKGYIYFSIEGIPIQELNIKSGGSPNWISAKVKDDNRSVKDFLESLSDNYTVCYKIIDQNTKNVATSSDDGIDFEISILHGYQVYCESRLCSKIDVCKADIDHSGTITDLDAERMRACLKSKNCNLSDYDITKDGIINAKDLTCLEENVLQICKK